jgi:hypothetical protein
MIISWKTSKEKDKASVKLMADWYAYITKVK